MMSSRLLGALVAVFSMLTMEQAWGQSRSDLILKGTLIYGWGETIKQTEFGGPNAGLTRELYRKPRELMAALSKVDEDRFVFNEDLGNRIKVFNRQTGQVSSLISGSGPTYLPQHDKLFFYRSEPGAGHLKLLIADWKDLTGSVRVIDEGPFTLTRQVVPVDEDRVVFLPRDNPSIRVKMFNVRTSETSELPIAGCVPKLWRHVTKQLLCFDIHRAEHVLIGLDGRNREQVATHNFIPLLYLTELDAALISFEEGHNHRVALYSLKEEERSKYKVVLRQAAVGTGDAILFANPTTRK